MDFRLMCKRAFDLAKADVPNLTNAMIDGSRVSYFSDHFSRQLKAASMVQDYLGLNPRGSVRIEWGGATGGECFQAAYEAVASGRMDCCLAVGYETMSRVPTWKGNEFIALASDTNFDFPLGGFYTGVLCPHGEPAHLRIRPTAQVRAREGRAGGPTARGGARDPGSWPRSR